MFNYLGNNSFSMLGLGGNFGYQGCAGISPLGFGCNPLQNYANIASIGDSINYSGLANGEFTGMDAPIFGANTGFGCGTLGGLGYGSPMMYGGCMPYNSTTQQMLNSMTPEQYVQMNNNLQKLQMQGQADVAQTGLQQNMALNRQYNQASIQQAIEMNRQNQQAGASIAEPGLIVQRKASVMHNEIMDEHNFQPVYDSFIADVHNLNPALTGEGQKAVAEQIYSQATGSSLITDIMNYSPSSLRKGFDDTFFGGLCSDGAKSRDENLAAVSGVEVPPTARTKEVIGKTLGIIATVATGVGALFLLGKGGVSIFKSLAKAKA